MKATPLPPGQAFLFALLGTLAYQSLFAVGGRYLTSFGSPSFIDGHLLLVWVPVLGSGAFYAWATRSASSSSFQWVALTIGTAVVSLAVSLAAVYWLVVLVWGE